MLNITGHRKNVQSEILVPNLQDIQEARAGQIIMLYNDDKYSKFTSPICAPGSTFLILSFKTYASLLEFYIALIF
jgi:hypothetical protein